MRRPNLTPSRRPRNPAIIRRRRKTDIQLLVAHLGALALGVDQQHRLARRIPALVVEDDGEDGDLVA